MVGAGVWESVAMAGTGAWPGRAWVASSPMEFGAHMLWGLHRDVTQALTVMWVQVTAAGSTKAGQSPEGQARPGQGGRLSPAKARSLAEHLGAGD